MNENVFLFQASYCGSVTENQLWRDSYCARTRCIWHSGSSDLPPGETY
jgi:hypothetical protein